MPHPIYQIDAFTTQTFKGNPAAIIPLQHWLPDETLKNIAMENNLSETAFFTPIDENNKIHIRWFTPTTEVDLCGHATLASAYVLFNALNHPHDTITFTGRSGDLFIQKTNNGYIMDFPVWEYEQTEITQDVTNALGAKPEALFKAYDWIALYDDETIIRNLTPNMKALAAIKDFRGIVPTAQSSDPNIDFISRVFCPAIGIDEDPVTGSAHCILTPFWAARLYKTKLNAH